MQYGYATIACMLLKNGPELTEVTRRFGECLSDGGETKLAFERAYVQIRHLEQHISINRR